MTSKTSRVGQGQGVGVFGDEKVVLAGKGLVVAQADARFEAQPGSPNGRLAGSWAHKAFLDGHTLWDALLFNACSNVGQALRAIWPIFLTFFLGLVDQVHAMIPMVLLVWPHQMARTGITPGLVLMIVTSLFAMWTMWLLVIFYVERRQILMEQGQWYDDPVANKREAVSQFHEVVGFFGSRWLQYFAQLLTAISLLGTGIAQVVACAGNYYSIDSSLDKRTLELIFGACLVMFALIPSFRHMRILNVIGIIGTGFTAWFIVVVSIQAGIKPGAYHVNASPKTLGGFFTGLSTLANAGHANTLEMVDVMQNAGNFIHGYSGGLLYSYFLTIPPSVAANLAFPQKTAKIDNIFGVLPASSSKVAAVWLMIIHQFIAFALYVLPLLYMWEKLIRTHTKPWFVRIPSRLPIALLVWLIGLLFPFYATINSFFAALTSPFIGVIIPCMLFNWHYRTPERREACPMKPWRPLRAFGWWPIFLFNSFLSVLYLVCFTGFGIYYNIVNIVKASDTFGILPACYQCSPSG